MGRGILSGLFWGSLLSVVVLGAVSLLSPVGEIGGGHPEAAGPEASEEASPGDTGATLSPLMESPEAESTPKPAADPAGASAEKTEVANEPASSVDVPAGSEFRKALPETDAEIPTDAQAPEANQAPMAPQPGAEDAALATQTDGAPRPETPGMSVSAPQAPTGGAEADGIEAVSVAPEAPATTPDGVGEPTRPEAGSAEAAPETKMASGFPPPAPIRTPEETATPEETEASEETVPPEESADAVPSTEMAETAPETGETPAVLEETAVEEAAAEGETTAEASESDASAAVASADAEGVNDGAAATEELAALAPQSPEAPIGITEPAAPAATGAPPEVTTAAPRVPEVNAQPAAPQQPDAAPETDGTPSETAATEQPVTERPVVSNRLPQIGATPADTTEATEVEEAEPAPVSGDTPTLGALARNARPFENPDGKPLFSVILIDEGAAGLDLSVLQTFTFPVTFAIDPMRPDAQAAADAFADAGFEVVVLATGLPAGATASDLETTLGSHLSRIPQAVAVMDPPQDGLAGERDLVQQAIAMAHQDGHGLIGWSKGLGPLETAMRKGGTPVAGIYRALDAEGERSSVIRRYLDRAAFKAAQDGSVIMVGSSRPETVTALFEWALSSKSGQVALAPVSAILRSR